MKYIPRLIESRYLKFLKEPKILIVLGARQVGKTTLVKHLMESRRTVFLNFDVEIDKQRFLNAVSLSPVEAIKILGVQKHLVVDEAQRVPETGRIVKGWYDSEIPARVVLLGSSSLNLLDYTAESLTGRNNKIFLTPLVFEEIISTQEWYSEVFTKEQLQEKFPEQIKTLLLQAIVFGSYPETVVVAEKREYLQNLVSDYLLKDVLQLGLVKTPEVIRRLLTLLAYQIGSEVSVNELANSLNISRLTVERYLDLLEQTFVVFRLRAFSTNQRKEIAKSSKIFFWDTGVRNALLGELTVNPLRSDIGQLWENWVIAEVAKKNLQTGGNKSLYFWRSRGGSEVDLIVKEGGGLKAYEIKWTERRVISKAFSDRYGVEVKIISPCQLPFNV